MASEDFFKEMLDQMSGGIKPKYVSTDSYKKSFKKPLNRIVIAVDFDGTIVKDRFPYVGSANPGAVFTIKRLKNAGVKIILWTCRTGQYLNDAINWCKRNGIEFDAVNENIPGCFKTSNKVAADLYIDDHSFPPFPGWDIFMKFIEQNYRKI